jgi:hypothetical protein
MSIQSSKEKNILYKSFKTNGCIKKNIKKAFESSKIRGFQKYFKNELKKQYFLVFIYKYVNKPKYICI